MDDDMDQEDYRPRRAREIPYRRQGIPPRSNRQYPVRRNAAPPDGISPVRRREVPSPRRQYMPQPEEEYDDEYIYSPPRRKPPRRKRSFWSAFFTGCAVAIFLIVLGAAALIYWTLRNTPAGGLKGIAPLGAKSYVQISTQQVQISSLSQLLVCDHIGNITITVDPQVNQTTIVTKKNVQADSQSEANQTFKQLNVEIQPPGTIQQPLNCARFSPPTATPTPGSPAQSNAASSLIVNVTIPNSSGLLPTTTNSVDVTITLPPTALPKPDLFLDVESSVGNTTISGLSGQLDIKGSTGNITIKQSYLMPGSDIETGQGDISFDGRLIVPTNPATQVTYRFSSEKGTLTLSLPDTTNVTVDANTNSGKIRGNFNLSAQTTGEAASYNGPLIAGAGTPAATLVADMSLGDIVIQKQQL
jgi:hypothetical protein